MWVGLSLFRKGYDARNMKFVFNGRGRRETPPLQIDSYFL